MKKLSLLFLLLIITTFCRSQNLVLNPGFEDSLQCPAGSGAFLNYIDVWTRGNWGSCDYFYTGCPVSPTNEPPLNGNAYTGIIVYDPANYREYLEGTLSSPLIAGTTYDVSFFVSLLDNCLNGISEVGVYFSTVNIFYQNANPIVLTPQVQDSVPLTLKSGWKKVHGKYTAFGGEQYLVIGSFTSDSLLTFTPAGTGNWSDVYYFIEDVSVVADSSLGTHTDLVPETIKLFPVPFSNELQITSKLNEQLELVLYDITSRKVQQKHFSEDILIDTRLLPDGIYFYEVRSKSGIVQKGKTIKQ